MLIVKGIETTRRSDDIESSGFVVKGHRRRRNRGPVVQTVSEPLTVAGDSHYPSSIHSIHYPRISSVPLSSFLCLLYLCTLLEFLPHRPHPHWFSLNTQTKIHTPVLLIPVWLCILQRSMRLVIYFVPCNSFHDIRYLNDLTTPRKTLWVTIHVCARVATLPNYFADISFRLKKGLHA